MAKAMTVGITMSNKTRPDGLKITGSYASKNAQKKSDEWMQKAEKLLQVTIFFGYYSLYVCQRR